MTQLIQIRIAAFSAFLVLSFALTLFVDAAIATGSVPQQVDSGADSVTNREGYRVKVPLPIDGQASASVRQALKRISEKTSLLPSEETGRLLFWNLIRGEGRLAVAANWRRVWRWPAICGIQI